MPVYSHSRLESFENCPLKYKFRYIDGIKKAEQGVEAFLVRERELWFTPQGILCMHDRKVYPFPG